MISEKAALSYALLSVPVALHPRSCFRSQFPLTDAEFGPETLQRLSARLVQAQEDERRSIARELHDEIGQALTAAKMELTLAKRGCPAPAGGRWRDWSRCDTARSRTTMRGRTWRGSPV